jgi:hypothetical protein
MIAEDLPSLALEGYQLARRYCVDCTDYHASRGFLRATGLTYGASKDFGVLAPHFAGLPPSARILLAGSGDTGQLTLVANALEGKRPKITLVDRCETPLLLCRSLANQHGIDLKTYRRDITDLTDLEPFDAILAHNFLSFFEAPDRSAVVHALAGALDVGGALFIVQRTQANNSRHQEKRERIPSAVSAFTAMFGEQVFDGATGASVAAMLDRHFLARTNRVFADRDLEDLAALLRQIGLEVEKLLLPSRSQDVETGADQGSRSKIYLMIARKSPLS